MSIDTLPDTINTLVEAEERAQCSQVVEEENTTHTLYFSVYSVSAVLPQTAGHNMPMHSPHFDRRVFNMRSSFEVAITSHEPGVESVIYIGVTSIMPNLMGVLLQTEDMKKCVQIDHDEVSFGCNLTIHYLSEEDKGQEYIRIGRIIYKVIDCR